MDNSTDNARVVLSGILPSNLQALEKAISTLTPEHFTDPVQRNIFKFLELFYSRFGQVVTKLTFDDYMAKKFDVGKRTLHVEVFDDALSANVTESDFEWAVSQLHELALERELALSLTESMEILKRGRTTEDGELIQGAEAAKEHLLESITLMDKNLGDEETPAGNVRLETKDILADYLERKNARLKGESKGILLGIQDVDRKLNGLQPGELVISAGYSSEGKTTLCVQAAWSAAVEQKKNVVFFTTETTREQVVRKLLSRHSRQSQFELPEGINSNALKTGGMSEAEEKKYFTEIVPDWRDGDYGQVNIIQVPRGATVATLENKLRAANREAPVDFVVMDYAALLSPTRHRASTREELTLIMKESKILATTFDKGRGVPFMTPWQVNRAGKTEADRVGYYTSSSLAETAESVNSADVIVSLLAPPENEGRYAELTMQILKSRDGEKANSMLVQVDYATSWFKSRSTAMGFGSPAPKHGSAQPVGYGLLGD